MLSNSCASLRITFRHSNPERFGDQHCGVPAQNEWQQTKLDPSNKSRTISTAKPRSAPGVTGNLSRTRASLFLGHGRYVHSAADPGSFSAVVYRLAFPFECLWMDRLAQAYLSYQPYEHRADTVS